jgi:hypothetical protein
MAARFDKPDSRWMPVPPAAAKEAVFWCAVLVAVVSGAILVGRMDAVFRFPEPAASSTVSAAPTVASVPATPAR